MRDRRGCRAGSEPCGLVVGTAGAPRAGPCCSPAPGRLCGSQVRPEKPRAPASQHFQPSSSSSCAPFGGRGPHPQGSLHGQTPGQAAGQERCSGAMGWDWVAGLAAAGVRSWRLWGTERTSTDKPGARPPTWHPKSRATHRGPNLRPGVTPWAGISIPRVSSTLGNCRREL